jgi:hypothetical protein
MQRIDTLLQKISELSSKGDKNTVIDIDLMLDYVRVVYADLLEWRGRMVFTGSLGTGVEEVSPKQVRGLQHIETKEESPVTSELTTNSVSAMPAADLEEVAETAIAEVKTGSLPEQQEKPVGPPYYFPEKKDIRKIIGINDKYQFISELFNNDRDTYEKTLDEINKQDSYAGAINWMKENVLFVNENEDDSTETAQTFYDALNTFFSDK